MDVTTIVDALIDDLYGHSGCDTFVFWREPHVER